MGRYQSILFILVLSFILGHSESSTAQVKVNFMEGSLSIAKPSGIFGRNITQGKFGFELGYLRQLKEDSPLFWGMAFYYHSLGFERDYVLQYADFGIYEFDSRTRSNLMGLNGKLRFYPDLYLGKFELYTELIIGYKWLLTVTNKTFVNDNDNSDTHIDAGSLSLSYGAALGVQYPISNETYINLRASYIPGLSTGYYSKNKNNIVNNYTIEAFDRNNSPTDIFKYDLGITYLF